MLSLHNKRILVIEDDAHIFELIKAMLKPYELEPVLKMDGKSGLDEALHEPYDLIILDIMLPEMDGWEVCRRLKNDGVETPIIVLTAKAEEADKVLGLEIGADDYITKPFSPREMVARMKAVLRRLEQVTEEESGDLEFSASGLTIDTRSYDVYVGERPVDLTPKEFELLSFMARREGQVFKREKLLNEIWGYDNYAGTRTVDEHIKRLRKKLSDAGLENVPLETIWGVGYKFSQEAE